MLRVRYSSKAVCLWNPFGFGRTICPIATGVCGTPWVPFWSSTNAGGPNGLFSVRIISINSYISSKSKNSLKFYLFTLQFHVWFFFNFHTSMNMMLLQWSLMYIAIIILLFHKSMNKIFFIHPTYIFGIPFFISSSVNAIGWKQKKIKSIFVLKWNSFYELCF